MFLKRCLLLIFFKIFFVKCIFSLNVSGERIAGNLNSSDLIIQDTIQKTVLNAETDLKVLNSSLREQLLNSNLKQGAYFVVEIEKKLNSGNQDSSEVADSYYYIGIYYKIINDFNHSLEFLNRSINIKENLKVCDYVYSRALYNLGGTYASLGLFELHKLFTIKAIEAEKVVFGPYSPELISTYGSLITAYIELKEYDKALEIAETAYIVADKNIEKGPPYDIAFMYNNIGVLYNKIGDYSKSILFFENAEKFYIKSGRTSEEGYINLLYNMSNALQNLGSDELSEVYRSNAVRLAKTNYSLSAYQILSNYAAKMGKSGKTMEGESILTELITKVESRFGKSSENYFEVLSFYADYLRVFSNEKNKALELYEQCIGYFNMQGDSFLKYFVMEGCALLLSERGEYQKSLEILQKLLVPMKYNGSAINILMNPPIDSLNADKDLLGALRTKYQILDDYYKVSNNLKILQARTNTSELIIALLDKIRITISEEESRLLMGDRYRDSYLLAIRDFYDLYNQTGEEDYLRKAFEYTEKSKTAGLLTATRELKATEFHIPVKLADEERDLQAEIALLNDRISGKSKIENTTSELVNIWKMNLFNTVRKRDSLINIFEKEYPAYYSFKYNTKVLQIDDIPDIIGKNSNYISYVATDTNIFISIVNKKYFKIISAPVDSSFIRKTKSFRNLLSRPDFNKARIEFRDYQTIGFELYNKLISPVVPYLISDRIVISPDNLLSYLPFETLPANKDVVELLSYKSISYLMDKYDISYTYSATFLAEKIRSKDINGLKTIAFAPDYSDAIDVKNLLHNRQQSGNFLTDLPFARQEAEYVSEVMNGKLLINGNAKESTFKREAGNYDIIHLAMHTLLDDNDPMYSTLIFSKETTGGEDRFLRTYEIYGIPLKARMVVLSSCNTGSGKLYSGEGILSLARGFIYSGSESVVMSMWEIEDKAGTEIVKLYYDYLKKGYSKSISLKKARTEFLKTADPLRAHPYFWSTLVIYGDDSPLFKPHRIKILVLLMMLIFSGCVIYYLRKRRYS